jgi:DNA-binding transcriptional LysR family regulator
MRLSPSDLKSLQVFRAVVEHDGFLGAQAALNMGQPGVSFHIKALEDRVGFRLCRRGRGGFALTEKGSLLYERSKSLFAALSTFESEVGELRHMISGTLRLGIVDNTITDPELPLHEVIHQFLRKAKQAQLNISVGVPEQLLTEIGNGGLDLAVMPETQRFKGLKFTRFYEEAHSLYCSAKHPLARIADAELDREAVERHPFVIRPYANLRELQHFSQAVAGATASNMEAQALFILSSHFVGYLPDHYARRWVEGKQLRPLLQETTGIASTFYVVTRESDRSSLLLRSFVQELVAGSWSRLHSVDDQNPRTAA